jgi:hypothetical protein
MPTPSDLVHDQSTSTGTGNLTLTAVNGKRSFNTAFGTGGTNVFDYFISNQSAAEWEIGTGHLSAATTFVRDTVVSSSNANAAVNFSGGTKDICNDVPAAKQVVTDLTQTLTNKTLTSPTVTTPTINGAVSGTSIATQADQESASSAQLLVSPARQHFHPSAFKAWARWNNAATIAASYNVSSVTDTGTGDWTVNFTTSFSSGNYFVDAVMDTGSPAGGAITDLMQHNGTAPAAGSCRMMGVSWDAGAALQAISDSPGGRIWAGFAGDQ